MTLEFVVDNAVETLNASHLTRKQKAFLQQTVRFVKYLTRIRFFLKIFFLSNYKAVVKDAFLKIALKTSMFSVL